MIVCSDVPHRAKSAFCDIRAQLLWLPFTVLSAVLASTSVSESSFHYFFSYLKGPLIDP